jgi:hypothetical protein
MYPGFGGGGLVDFMLSLAEGTACRRGYPPEFRRKVLDLLKAGRTVAQLPRDLQISDQTICNWRRQEMIDTGQLPGVTRSEQAELMFAADGPNQLWLIDITEHATGQGKLYLCAVKDVFSTRLWGTRSIPGWRSRLAVNAQRTPSPSAVTSPRLRDPQRQGHLAQPRSVRTWRPGRCEGSASHRQSWTQRL